MKERHVSVIPARQFPAPEFTPSPRALRRHRTKAVLREVQAERGRQEEQWGEQNHPDNTGDEGWQQLAFMKKDHNDLLNHPASQDVITWADILEEEFLEAMAEGSPAGLRAELVQVAAVAVAWVEAIDRREEATSG